MFLNLLGKKRDHKINNPFVLSLSLVWINQNAFPFNILYWNNRQASTLWNRPDWTYSWLMKNTILNDISKDTTSTDTFWLCLSTICVWRYYNIHHSSAIYIPLSSKRLSIFHLVLRGPFPRPEPIETVPKLPEKKLVMPHQSWVFYRNVSGEMQKFKQQENVG